MAATSVPQRILALDVLRGIAILGTLLTNIWIFVYADADFLEMFERSSSHTFAQSFQEAEGLLLVETVLGFILGLITDGKFIGLLTIMFGIGIEIQRQAALRKGERWPGRYPWRACLLILDGLLNYIFIFEFDVLMGYGITALIVALILTTGAKAQKIWIWIALGWHVLVMLFFTAVFVLIDQLDLWDVILAEAETESGALLASHDSYIGQVQHRLEDFVAGRAELPIIIVLGIGLFLIGSRLYRAGLFLPEGRRLRQKMLIWCLGGGLAVDWGLRIAVGFPAMFFTRYVTSPIVAFGILAAVAAFYANRMSLGLCGQMLTYVGRMALTCYILQNLLAGIIFYNWGLGMSKFSEGPYQFWWGLGIFLAIAVVLIAFCAIWLRFFRRGPLEALWGRAYTGIASRRDYTARDSKAAEVTS